MISLPPRFLARMRELLQEDYEAFLQGYEQPLRRGLRVNTLKISPERLLQVFPLPLIPSPFADDAFYLNAPHKAGGDPLHHAGAYYMQEPSASSAVTVLSPKPQEHILDLCAAPGGKSTQIAAALQGNGLLWCNEYVRPRAQILIQNLERLGVRNAVVTNLDTAPLCEALENCFDAVLADVPCSGEGMFRKEEVALTQWSEALVTECAERGAYILENAAKAVRDGGRIVYSTCTFAPEENELQIAKFLTKHPEFTLCPIDVPFGRPALSAAQLTAFDPAVDRSVPTEFARRIFPADGGEGHFIALLKKQGDASRKTISKRASKPDDTIRLAQILLEDCFLEPPQGTLARYGDIVRLLPDGMPAVSLPIMSAGVIVGTLAKNRLEPHHALFTSTPPAQCRRVEALTLTDPRTAAFLHGEEIAADTEKGYTAVTVEGVACGFGKVSGGTLKNRYPKGLRTF